MDSFFMFVLLATGVLIWLLAKKIGRKITRGPIRLLLPESIHPVDVALTTAQAKVAYRKALLAVNPKRDKEILRELVDGFADDLRMREAELVEAVENAGYSENWNSAEDLKIELNELKQALKHDEADPDEDDWEEREELKKQIAEMTAELATLRERVKAAKLELAGFRKDKRGFLVDYYNTSRYGSGWRQHLK